METDKHTKSISVQGASTSNISISLSFYWVINSSLPTEKANNFLTSRPPKYHRSFIESTNYGITENTGQLLVTFMIEQFLKNSLAEQTRLGQSFWHEYHATLNHTLVYNLERINNQKNSPCFKRTSTVQLKIPGKSVILISTCMLEMTKATYRTRRVWCQPLIKFTRGNQKFHWAKFNGWSPSLAVSKTNQFLF